MTRSNRIISSQYPYHVTARTNNRAWFDSNLDQIWSVYVDYCIWLSHAYDFKIHCFVLMKNHFHLITSTPQSNLSQGMGYFMTQTAREINRIEGTQNHLYGRRFYSSVIEDLNYFLTAYKYVARNPVKAGICHRVEDYRFSTVGLLFGLGKMPIPVSPAFFEDYAGHATFHDLEWLNRAFKSEENDAIRRGMRHRRFALSPPQATKKRIEIQMPYPFSH